MSRICVVSGKRAMKGNKVSHSNHKTIKRTQPNLQDKRFWLGSEERWVRLRLSVSSMRDIDKKNLYAVNGDLTLEGDALKGGSHTVTVRRTGTGAVYFNSYLSFFTLEDNIKAAGLELKVDRKYWKLERQDRVHQIAGDRGQGVASTEVRYKKTPMSTGDDLQSGDLIHVELMVSSKNDYTDLAFEDPKPAGAEPLALRSGSVVGEGVSHMELRDDKVVFFLPQITQGKLKMSYRLRAEIPGKFSAMPTKAFAMYAPELVGNSDEMKIAIHDAPGD